MSRPERVLVRLLSALERGGALRRLGRGKLFEKLLGILDQELRECPTCKNESELR